MEESTEAHMETDVSSTTEDVPETQEVTGSNGNVEMIIVVEKVVEEDMNSDTQSEKQPEDNEDTNEVSKPSEESPQMDVETTSNSPIKVIELAPSPTKPEQTQKVVNTNLELDSEIELSAETQQTEDADSSMKEPEQIDNEDTPKSSQSSPKKIQKSSVEDSPQKDKQTANSPQKDKHSVEESPQKDNYSVEKSAQKDKICVDKNPQKDKISVEKSPQKDKIICVDKSPQKDKISVEKGPQKDVPRPIQMSPSKEVKLSDSTRSSPAKESLLVEKFDINGKITTSNDDSNDSSNKLVTTVIPINITIERDASNDSQLDTKPIETSDLSEKEHNKSISRELKSLINSAKESKIISECTQLTSKTRKSRSALDSSSTSLNTSIDAEKIGNRRHSNNSQKSNCSEKSEKLPVKRSMRSQNPEFVSKVKQFLNSVTGKSHKESDDDDDDEEKGSKDKGGKDKKDENDTLSSPPKMRKTEPILLERPGKLRSDSYCWRCHWAVEQGTEKTHAPMLCTVCPRSFHFKCLTSNERNKINTEKSWVCPECLLILQAESSETRSPAMKKISLGMLCELLKHALERMMDLNGVEPFMQPVDRSAFPDYDKYVVHPMDLSLMKSNIEQGLYGSTEAFVADAQWILHNSIIFNTLQSKLTGGARALVRSCRAEAGEIEACPQCYAAAHARRPTWFTDVCSTPHILLWAKLKGFPYWPAKGMSVSSAGHVDVRFFGAHDRAWVPSKDCFLYSEKDPNNFRTKRQDIIDSMQEAEEHIRNISRKYGKFVYPPFRTQFDPTKLNEQLKMMIPAFDGELPTKEKSTTSSVVKGKRRSNSKSSKGSYNDGEMSENEDTAEGESSSTVASRKMADGAEIAREEEDTNVDREVSMEVDTSTKLAEQPTQSSTATETPSKSVETARKRRRSKLEEAVITIIETQPEPKRKKADKQDKKKSQEQEPSSSKETEDTDEKTKNGPIEEDKSDENADKEDEPTSTRPEPEREKVQRVTPIRIALVQKDRRHNLRTSTTKEAMAKIISPTKDKDKEKSNEKTTPLRQKSVRTEKAEKTAEKTPKQDKLTRAEKRRNSRNNRSLTSTPKGEKPRRLSLDKQSEKTAEATMSKDKAKDSKDNKEKAKETTKEIKDKAKENAKDNKEKAAESNKEKAAENGKDKESKESETEKAKRDKRNSTSSPKPTNTTNADSSIKSVKDRLQFDDDTTLAVIARESRTVVISSSNQSGLPTISCVRSLSTTAQNTGTTITKVTTTTANNSEVTIETISDSSSTSTSAEKDKNAKDAASKLQRLRNDVEPMVGRVGVRAFARMSSIDQSPKNDDVQVEIKAEPIDVDDADRHLEKLNLMNAFRLRPVNPTVHTPSNLREVRINKVLVTPLNAKKGATKTVEIRPRAKKTFPQPKKPEDGQLNSKNSMVYIPIQPPMTQAPVRPPRVVAGATCPPPTVKPTATNSTNSLVNTVTTPVMQVSSMVTSPPTSTINTSVSLPSMGTIGQVPTAVHTVPLMTSVNGQWMFSFQPVMSVGAIENSPSPPILNGVADRNNSAAILPLPGALAPMSVASGVTTPAVVNSTATTAVQPHTNKGPGDTSAPGEPPRLQQRPATVLMNPLDPNTPIGIMPTPSTAGPVTAKLNQNAVKLTDFFRTLLEDSLEKLDEPATMVTTLRLHLEQVKWKHQAEIKEIKHNHELTLAEQRALFEKEKCRAVAEARRTAQVELEAAVKAAKSKQWCANCSQEAQFYCCWNTSYCDYPCQRAHWAQHFNVCTQKREDRSKKGEPPAPAENRLKSELPKSAAPALTVGGKLAHSAPAPAPASNNNTHPQKSAIIVSMVEDPSGNQTMKCVGTYKSPAQNVSPIILNKQIMNSEENANKKVVSSGGYLIVGGAHNAAVVTPPRRGHTIQYLS